MAEAEIIMRVVLIMQLNLLMLQVKQSRCYKISNFKAHLFLDKRHPKYEMYKSFELTEKEFEKLSIHSREKYRIFFNLVGYTFCNIFK